MKKIVSISLGSVVRDAKAYAKFGGEEFEISRIGTNGNLEEMRQLYEELDNEVDAFGIGGTDLYIFGGPDKKIPLPMPNRLIAGLKTPVFDGSLLKMTLEPMVLEKMQAEKTLDLTQSRVFCTVGAERFGMASVLDRYSKELVFGDLVMSLGLPFPIKKLSTLARVARIAGPLIVRLPFEWLYPTGENQEERNYKYVKYFQNADVIAGDFLYILKYRPDDMSGKVVLTNTTTEENIQALKESGVSRVITTTPEIDGRTFGTNVMEAMLYTLIGKESPGLDDFRNIITELGMDQGNIFNC
ncbi:MAG: quinate 5-dehydrogenase [bacterium]|nr:quinate 5-dehydrogenase [bacterium]